MLKFSYFLSLFVLLAVLSNSLHGAEKPKIKAIVFDFGGVIAKTDKQEVANFIAKSLDISSNEALDAINQLKTHTNAGKNEKDFWLAYTKSKEKKLPAHWQEQLEEARLHALKDIPGMIDVVKELQKQGYQTALLSNVRQSQAEIKRQLGYYELFHPALFSYEIGVKKPDLKAYYLLLNKLQMTPQEVLFIDNKLVNIEAAKSIGMDAIDFVNTAQLIQELKQRGIKISLPQICKQTNPS